MTKSKTIETTAITKNFKFKQSKTISLAEFEQLPQSYNSLHEKPKTEQSEESIKERREHDNEMGRKRRCHLAFSTETYRIKSTQVVDWLKK